MTKPYQWRGTVPLKPDDHEFWRLVQKRVAQKWPWEQIAVEIGCHVDDLIHWANWVYKPPRKPVAAKASRAAVLAGIHTAPEDLPVRSSTTNAARFLAWKRARDGARAAREAMNA